MNKIKPKVIICFLVCIIVTSSCFAHGELTARINEKSKLIKKDPSNAQLYFDRGFLYEQHEEYQKAIKDYLKSEKLGFEDKRLHFRKGETYKITANFELALKEIETYKLIAPDDVIIFRLEAQVLASMQLLLESKKAYYFVLNNSKDILPEDVLEFCDIVLKENNSNYKECLKIINKALLKLQGNSIVLKAKRIDYLIALDKSEQVIRSYNQFIVTQKRKEIWYYKKAHYLSSIQKNDEAMIALQQAKISIQKLPAKFKQTPTISNLMNQISDLEQTLNQ